MSCGAELSPDQDGEQSLALMMASTDCACCGFVKWEMLCAAYLEPHFSLACENKQHNYAAGVQAKSNGNCC